MLRPGWHAELADGLDSAMNEASAILIYLIACLFLGIVVVATVKIWKRP